MGLQRNQGWKKHALNFSADLLPLAWKESTIASFSFFLLILPNFLVIGIPLEIPYKYGPNRIKPVPGAVQIRRYICA
jgi:hypothetical protein